MLAWAAWQLQFSPTACGTLRKHVTKPFTQPAAQDCIKFHPSSAVTDLGHHLDCLEDVDNVVDPPPLGRHLLGQVVERDLAPLRGRDLSREAGDELVAQQSQGLVFSRYLENEEFLKYFQLLILGGKTLKIPI